MVVLYGVTHGAREVGIFGGSEEIPLLPSREFLEHLAQFPPGTKVGIEWGKEEERQEVQEHLTSLCLKNHLPLGTYPDTQKKYWKEIIAVCRNKDYEVLLLEDKNIWFRYNEALVEMMKCQARREVDRQQRENGRKYSEETAINWQEKLHRLALQSRKIHEIGRDDHLREKVATLDVAVVGKAHSDHWLHYKKVECEKYSTDTVQSIGPGEVRAFFTENAIPDPRTAYERISLERSLCLMQAGRLSEKKADYVGTWDLSNPWQGYFELFLQQKPKKEVGKVPVKSAGAIIGTIEDCIGSATFEGWLRPNGIDFFKEYTESTQDALKRKIYYYAESRTKEEFAGWFSGSLGDVVGRIPFYMIRSAQGDIRTFPRRWHDLVQKQRRNNQKKSGNQ